MSEYEVVPTGEPVDAALHCQASPPHRILVVEDEPLVRQLNVKILVNAGYHADAVADGAVAWDTLQCDAYDLLITDNNMPKVSGVELIMKVHAARMVLPVIMATGAAPEQEFIRRPWLQPDALLLKPYTASEFLRVVKIVLCGDLLAPGDAY
jgi:two-component system alkaline phosphatase synthesis response regulator PhoP